MWIYEYDHWPTFSWRMDSLASELVDIRYRHGRLLGQLENLGLNLKREATLRSLTSEVTATSAIEGVFLNPDEVRSSVARHLGIPTAGIVYVGRDIEGIVEIALDATQRYSKPLTEQRLFEWHAALFPTGFSGMHRIKVAGWRTMESGPMQVVSGPIGRETIHFQAPSADSLETEMSDFISWFENQNDLDPVIKAGIAHLWFVTIHPFEDGNGRIARAITDMALTRADGMPDRFYSLSAQIASERQEYYNQLERQQRGSPEITDWLEWFVGCFGRAISRSEQVLANILFKAKLWDVINQKPVNERQRLIINRMLEEDFVGHMNTSKYAKMSKCSTDTALRDIQELKGRGILIQNSGSGRSTSYRLPDEVELTSVQSFEYYD